MSYQARSISCLAVNSSCPAVMFFRPPWPVITHTVSTQLSVLLLCLANHPSLLSHTRLGCPPSLGETGWHVPSQLSDCLLTKGSWPSDQIFPSLSTHASDIGWMTTELARHATDTSHTASVVPHSACLDLEKHYREMACCSPVRPASTHCSDSAFVAEEERHLSYDKCSPPSVGSSPSGFGQPTFSWLTPSKRNHYCLAHL